MKLLLVALFSAVLAVKLLGSPIDDAWFTNLESQYLARLATLKAQHESDTKALLEKLKQKAWTAEAFVVRDYLRQLGGKKDLTPEEVVQTPAELKELQVAFLSAKQLAANEILGGAQQEIDSTAADLTSKGEIDKSAAMLRKFESLKSNLGYAGMSVLKGSAASLPPEISITNKVSLQMSVLGQTTIRVELEPGETYKTRGITGDSIVIQIGTDSVAVPIANTDFADRVAAMKKGTQQAAPSQNENPPESGNSASSSPSAWQILRPLPGSDVNFFSDRIDFHNRGNIVSRKNYSSATIELTGEFKSSSDVFDVYLRASEARSNPFGAPDSGVTIHLDMPTGSLSAFTWNHTGDGRQDIAAVRLGLRPGERFTLKVVDDGFSVKVFLNDPRSPRLQFKTPRKFGTKIVLHNREGGHSFTLRELKLSGR